MTEQHYRETEKSANRPHYRRSAWATAILLLSLCVFISAGIWQLDRAGQKQDMKARFSAGSIVKPGKILPADASGARFRVFEITGKFDNDQQILLDSMTEQGQNGYHVLTPFFTQDKQVLVNRGWIKADPDRSQLPDVRVSPKERTILARLNKLPEPGIRLDAPETAPPQWPRRLLFPTHEQITANLGYHVADYQLLLDPLATDGYLRDWKAVAIGPEKNFGYAFQWFAFALLAVTIYITLNLRWRKQLKAQQV